MSFSQLFLLQSSGDKEIQLPVFQCNKLQKGVKNTRSVVIYLVIKEEKVKSLTA